MPCCEIPEDAKCSLHDAVMDLVAECMEIDPARVFGSSSNASGQPRVIVTDLGESDFGIELCSHTEMTRRFRVRYYDCSKSKVVSKFSTSRQKIKACSVASQEAFGNSLQVSLGGYREFEHEWRVEFTIRMKAYIPKN